MTHVFSIHILTIYHKAPTHQESIAQRVEDEISSSLRVDTRQDFIDRWKARYPMAHFLYQSVVTIRQSHFVPSTAS